MRAPDRSPFPAPLCGTANRPPCGPFPAPPQPRLISTSGVEHDFGGHSGWEPHCVDACISWSRLRRQPGGSGDLILDIIEIMDMRVTIQSVAPDFEFVTPAGVLRPPVAEIRCATRIYALAFWRTVVFCAYFGEQKRAISANSSVAPVLYPTLAETVSGNLGPAQHICEVLRIWATRCRCWPTLANTWQLVDAG